MNNPDKELFLAVQRDDLRAATDALNQGASVDYRINPGAWNNRDAASAFCNALLRGNPVMVELLLDHGADPNRELSGAYDYQTYNIAPLMLALDEGHEAVARLLIERGANPKSEHRFGKEDSGVGEISALGLAAKKGFLGVVKLLLERGASFNYAYTSALPEQSFSSALDMAGSPEVSRYLEEWQARKSRGADIGASASSTTMATSASSAETREASSASVEAWLECGEGGPGQAISTLRNDPRNYRKLFLAGCGWARRFWDQLGKRSKTAIEVYERFADGEVREGDYEAAWARFQQMFDKDGDYFAWQTNFFTALIQARAAWHRALPYMKDDPAAEVAIVLPARGVYSLGRGAYLDASDEFAFAGKNRNAEYQAQCEILRDVFGDRIQSLSLPPAGQFTGEGDVAKLAAAIYRERAFDRMPELGDALESSGCNNQQVLDHCRSREEHVRGCWVIDWLLGKDQIKFPFGARMPLLLQADIDAAPVRF